ncbi:DUF1642 domain-containing protein [Listeria booriae]|uniref:DUF1642 domain-containing protein n=1 Tax=Listeria booriae TaxID=1552123 RepID=UPI001626AF4E|nr:DUF1642 domain-containing protein [Listeria booriae]MBC1974535.1 DUF1642 domain-containing protein [Listeria booriae]MBC2031827.1 DUF1642 domain-containing protein [Listeria booriae]
MTQKFKVGDRVQVIRDSKIEIDTITFKDGTIYQLQDKSWVEDCRLAPAPVLVKVPQNVKEQIELALHYNQQNKENALEGLLQDYYIRTEYESESVGEWIANNFAKFISAVLDGYEVEKESLYYIKLPALGFLVDEPEIDFVVSKEFASKFNKAQIKAVDERYWQFAVPEEGK